MMKGREQGQGNIRRVNSQRHARLAMIANGAVEPHGSGSVCDFKLERIAILRRGAGVDAVGHVLTGGGEGGLRDVVAGAELHVDDIALGDVGDGVWVEGAAGADGDLVVGGQDGAGQEEGGCCQSVHFGDICLCWGVWVVEKY